MSNLTSRENDVPVKWRFSEKSYEKREAERIREGEKIERAKEIKLVVVGKAGVGKTALLCCCQNGGETSSSSFSSSVGMELSSFTLEDMSFNCFDFGGGAGQFQCTHQLFLTNHSICLVVFDMRLPQERNVEEVASMFECVTHQAPRAAFLLVGTHCKNVEHSENKSFKIQDEMGRRFRSVYLAGTIVLDSVEDVNISEFKKMILRVAHQKVSSVPNATPLVLSILSDYNQRNKHILPVISQEEAELQLNFLSPQLRINCIDALHELGRLTKIEWESVDRSKRQLQWSVVLDPRWLMKLLRTIGSIKDKKVKNGIIRLEALKGLLAKEVGFRKPGVQDMIFSYLKNLDVVQSIDSSASTNQLLMVPALLPDREEVSEEFVDEKYLFHETNHQHIARVFVLEQRSIFPMEVMGRVYGVLFRVEGDCISAWRGGCTLLSQGVQIRVRKVRIRQVRKKKKKIEELQTSLGKNGSHELVKKHVSLSSKESLIIEGIMVVVDQRTETGVRLFQRVEQGVRNVLTGFYCLNYRLIVPATIPVEEELISDWFEMSDILGAVQVNQKIVESKVFGVERRPLWLCPDLDFKENWVVPLLERAELDFENSKILGEGSYGIVYLASWKKGDRKDEAYEEMRIVVKELKVVSEAEGFSNFLKMQQEAYVMSRMSTQYVVQLLGIQTLPNSPPLLILEFLKGGNLLDQLIDPFGLVKAATSFIEIFDRLYLEVDDQEKRPMRVVGSSNSGFIEKLSELDELVNLLGERNATLGKMLEGFLRSCEEHWVKRSQESGRQIKVKQGEVFAMYQGVLNDICPYSLAVTLRICADVSAALHHLHSMDPPMISRDLKSQNVFLLHPLDGLDSKEAQRIQLAKLGDFGLTVNADSDLRMTDGRGDIGNINPLWVAPEILSRRPFGVESDIYSLGLLMWETRYREVVFCGWEGGEERGKLGDGFFEVVKERVVAGERPKLKFEDRFDRLMRECWAPNPASRPTALEVFSTLKEIAGEMGFHELVTSLSRDSKKEQQTIQKKSKKTMEGSWVPKTQFNALKSYPFQATPTSLPSPDDTFSKRRLLNTNLSECNRCSTISSEALQECQTCQQSFCLICCKLSGLKNPCDATGLTHHFPSFSSPPLPTSSTPPSLSSVSPKNLNECDRCSTRVDITQCHQCQTCQQSFCLSCCKLSGLKNPCTTGLAHIFPQAPSQSVPNSPRFLNPTPKPSFTLSRISPLTEKSLASLEGKDTNIEECGRCSSLHSRALRQCQMCHESYCLACCELSGLKNPCSTTGLAHQFQSFSSSSPSSPRFHFHSPYSLASSPSSPPSRPRTPFFLSPTSPRRALSPSEGQKEIKPEECVRCSSKEVIQQCQTCHKLFCLACRNSSKWKKSCRAGLPHQFSVSVSGPDGPMSEGSGSQIRPLSPIYFSGVPSSPSSRSFFSPSLLEKKKHHIFSSQHSDLLKMDPLPLSQHSSISPLSVHQAFPSPLSSPRKLEIESVTCVGQTSLLWVGLTSGDISVYDLKDFTKIPATAPKCLLAPEEGVQGIPSMTFSWRTDTVWTVNGKGRIQVWRSMPLSLKTALEETYLESLEPQNHLNIPGDIEIGIGKLKGSFKSCYLVLRRGRLFILRETKFGLNSKMIDLKDVIRVWAEGNKFYIIKRKSSSSTTVTPSSSSWVGGDKFCFRVRKREEPWRLAREWVKVIQYAHFISNTNKNLTPETLFLVAESPTEQDEREGGEKKKIVSLKEAGVLIWAVDNELRVSGWEIAPDVGGKSSTLIQSIVCDVCFRVNLRKDLPFLSEGEAHPGPFTNVRKRYIWGAFGGSIVILQKENFGEVRLKKVLFQNEERENKNGSRLDEYSWGEEEIKEKIEERDNQRVKKEKKTIVAMVVVEREKETEVWVAEREGIIRIWSANSFSLLYTLEWMDLLQKKGEKREEREEISGGEKEKEKEKEEKIQVIERVMVQKDYCQWRINRFRRPLSCMALVGDQIWCGTQSIENGSSLTFRVTLDREILINLCDESAHLKSIVSIQFDQFLNSIVTCASDGRFVEWKFSEFVDGHIGGQASPNIKKRRIREQ